LLSGIPEENCTAAMLSDALQAPQRRWRGLDWFATRHIARSNKTVFSYAGFEIRLIPASAFEPDQSRTAQGFQYVVAVV